jgi:hypothetical protein
VWKWRNKFFSQAATDDLSVAAITWKRSSGKMTTIQRIRLYIWWAYHLAFEEYFLVLSRGKQALLIAALIVGCIVESFFAAPLGVVAVVAVPIVLPIEMFGAWVIVGRWMQQTMAPPVIEYDDPTERIRIAIVKSYRPFVVRTPDGSTCESDHERGRFFQRTISCASLWIKPGETVEVWQ